ncbi:substrate-binding periplasmic protein [Kiloniella sp.]|uniref:substrate-binding periplasmic protein n=1 Tax=Kiloniella sp. TaxID=1938587 RepID=UPI003B029F74
MRKTNNYIIAFLTFSLLSFFPVTGHAKNISLNLAYSNVETFPTQMGEGSGVSDPPGLAIDIIQRASDEMGIDLSLARYPNKRVQAYLNQSKIDGAFVFSYKPERYNWGVYPWHEGKLDKSRRVFEYSYHLYYREDQPNTYERFKAKDPSQRIGVNRGYSIGGDLIAQGHLIEESNTTASNIKKLVTGRIDAVALHSVTADSYLKTHNITGIKKVPHAIKSKSYYLVISNEFYLRDPGLVERLWSKIGTLRDQVIAEKAANYLKPTE